MTEDTVLYLAGLCLHDESVLVAVIARAERSPGSESDEQLSLFRATLAQCRTALEELKGALGK